ncbi:hypothetical protein AVEN_223556-1 [Araneus ventricosus]|uniref:Uncharacterized protein n=1 Tax=Araneus ventricosus TaxID=182803 RepID=A0A4Y2RVB1_ARAVE|nr:hypothetical protein AVEN_223556-1 [Araneus ventricosus]
MTSSPLKNLLEKNEKEKVELKEAKANRVFKQNGDKTEEGKALKAKKKLILNSIENPVTSTSSTKNEGQYAQVANTHMMQIGSRVDYVRSGGMRSVPVMKAVEHLYATTAKFSGRAYSWPHVG